MLSRQCPHHTRLFIARPTSPIPSNSAVVGSGMEENEANQRSEEAVQWERRVTLDRCLAGMRGPRSCRADLGGFEILHADEMVGLCAGGLATETKTGFRTSLHLFAAIPILLADLVLSTE